ncbi:AraC-type DNA-binding protein [Thermostaphylospora chromogena]|uniref:AraC-type DNA-binding protein n=2 Tax=Thermostaphylospora chromogena TaxID=35622 RepID=A0A1H1H9C1_9ACTN|nr:AraC-type DNA-binding protein [Thermostaphylospora chromogena]
MPLSPVHHRGWATIEPGRLYYGGHIGAGDLHAHPAVQLMVGDELILAGADGVEHTMTAALIPANTPHAIVRDAAGVLLALIDPAQAGRASHRPRTGSATAWRVDLDLPADRDLPTLQELVTSLTETAPPRPRHPALIRAAQIIEEMLPGRVRLGDVAAAVHLSESRLSHLFSGEFGLPFRPYVLWARLRVALAAVSRGASLTEAAHTAGFADAAHLTRTVHRMMGEAPSALADGVRWLG